MPTNRPADRPRRLVSAEPLEPRRLLAGQLRVYFMGNSMTDQARYGDLDTMATSRGFDHVWGRHTVLGSAISTLWNTPANGFMQSPYGYYPQALGNHTWDAITLNPTDREIYQSDGDGDVTNALKFINLARQQSPNVQTYLLQRTPRRPRTPEGGFSSIDYPARWLAPHDVGNTYATFTREYFNNLVTELRREQPAGSKPARLIPVGDVMYELDSRIKQGRIPGVSNINQVYSDASHYTNLGAYVTGLTFFATLYGQSPVGLGVPSGYGGNNSIPADRAAALQQTVWDVVRSTPFTGVNDTSATNYAPYPAADFDPVGLGGTRSFAFDGSASTDPDGDNLRYLWNFGDGSTSTQISPQKAYATDGVYSVTLTVTDPSGTSRTSKPLAIHAGNAAPEISIAAPFYGQRYQFGQNFTFSGSAVDSENGALSPFSMNWRVVQFANQGTTTIIPSLTNTASGSFTLNQLGDATKDPDRWYRIFLTATDSDGRKTTQFADLRPLVSTITTASNLSGTAFKLDQLPAPAGTPIRAAVGTPYSLIAPPTQVSGGVTYRFQSWSDGNTSATRAITAGTSNATYTARYVVGSTTSPMTTRRNPVADAYVRDGSFSNTNYGNTTDLLVKTSGGANSGYNRESHLRFSIASRRPARSAASSCASSAD